MTAQELKAGIRRSLPDEPLWVETRDLLECHGSNCEGDSKAFVVWSPVDDLGVIVGGAPKEVVCRAATECSELLAFSDNIQVIRQLLPDWVVVNATVLSAPGNLVQTETHPSGILSQVDIERERDLGTTLRGELLDALADGKQVYAALDGSHPVSFAYAASETETLFDISIDTLPSHRRRGFAQSAVRRLTKEMRGIGKSPVWGAAEDNPASLSLALGLGFSKVGSVFVVSRRSPCVP
jgi:hypothetical protein